MKKRDARTLADKIHDLYVTAAVEQVGFDLAYAFTRKAIRVVSTSSSGAGYNVGLLAFAEKAVKAQCLMCRTQDVEFSQEEGWVHTLPPSTFPITWDHCEARHIHSLIANLFNGKTLVEAKALGR